MSWGNESWSLSSLVISAMFIVLYLSASWSKLPIYLVEKQELAYLEKRFLHSLEYFFISKITASLSLSSSSSRSANFISGNIILLKFPLSFSLLNSPSLYINDFISSIPPVLVVIPSSIFLFVNNSSSFFFFLSDTNLLLSSSNLFYSSIIILVFFISSIFFLALMLAKDWVRWPE